MSDTKQQASGGIGFAGLLAILFIALKLTHVIDWSWWWVLAPLWGGAAIMVVIVLLVVLGVVAHAVYGWQRDRKRRRRGKPSVAGWR